jgi:hypothetical protein
MVLAPVLVAAGSSPINISVSPSAFSANVSTTNGTTSSSATLTISGGVAPYTAIWISDNLNISVTSSTSTTSSTFGWTGLASLFDSEFAAVTIGITDNVGNYAEYIYSVVITRTS